MNDLQTTATEINRLHQQAHASAQSAVEYAKAAGKLLHEAKAAMQHGDFIPWILANTSVSPRQAQRYMSAAVGKSVSVRDVIPKCDMMSHLLPAKPRTSLGVWAGDVWMPEPGFLYCFAADNGTFWVAPAPGEGTHVSRLYSGERMSTDGFAWRYTIFAENNDPDLSDQWYVGTRFAPLNRAGVHGILKSYGLDDFKGAKIKGVRFDDTFERPFSEPDPGQWYWDAPLPDDDLYVILQIEGMVNKHGVPLLL